MSTEPAQDANASTPAGDPAGVDVRPARRILLEIGVAVLLVMLLRIFVMESFHVPSGSMAPTIQPGDRVVVTKIGASHVERGDVVFPKSTKRERMEENFGIFDFSLTDDQVAAITALDRGEDGRTGPNPDTFDYIPD